VSTIKEAESITPLLLGFKEANRAVNVSYFKTGLNDGSLRLSKVKVLYGFPVPPSGTARLAAVSMQLGPGGLSLLVDHPDQLPSVYKIKELSGNLPHIYIKIDMGYGRAGVPPQTQTASQLISDVLQAEEVGAAVFHGLYTHAGQSYFGNSRASAVDLLRQEFEALLMTAELVKSATPREKLVLSVGATPTTTSIRNLLVQESALTAGEQTAIAALKGTIQEIRSKDCEVELHAGVYTVLDVQQLATHALSSPMLGWSDLALTIMVEVASIYPGRGEGGRSEALIAAGSLALGLEPCKAYPGWGIVSPWNIPNSQSLQAGPEDHEGWQVGRISQEHGILTWKGNRSPLPLVIGQKVRIFPNHACIAGACFDWYLVFDSENLENKDRVIDVWPRWRGW
jgi:D-serine ammonia-lyase